MKIYVTHATGYEFERELYQPLIEGLAVGYELFLPHRDDAKGVKSKEIIAGSDVVLAEVSRPSTGQGIELGWADDSGVPIVCFYRSGSAPSGALRFVARSMFEYCDQSDMINQLTAILKTL